MRGAELRGRVSLTVTHNVQVRRRDAPC
jgi:hypothetical protein